KREPGGLRAGSAKPHLRRRSRRQPRWCRFTPRPRSASPRWRKLGAASSANRSTEAPRLVLEGRLTPTSANLPASLFLRSLQLLGFKTFARQTEIQFDGGVTAIVGPNGSGKTNIVDAVKWVLGSGQARDIRGRRWKRSSTRVGSVVRGPRSP